MKKIIFMILLTTVSFAASADWEALRNTASERVKYNTDTLRAAGDVRNVELMVDYKANQYQNRKSVHWIGEFRCASKKFITRSAKHYEGESLSGNLIGQQAESLWFDFSESPLANIVGIEFCARGAAIPSEFPTLKQNNYFLSQIVLIATGSYALLNNDFYKLDFSGPVSQVASITIDYETNREIISRNYFDSRGLLMDEPGTPTEKAKNSGLGILIEKEKLLPIITKEVNGLWLVKYESVYLKFNRTGRLIEYGERIHDKLEVNGEIFYDDTGRVKGLRGKDPWEICFGDPCKRKFFSFMYTGSDDDYLVTIDKSSDPMDRVAYRMSGGRVVGQQGIFYTGNGKKTYGEVTYQYINDAYGNWIERRGVLDGQPFGAPDRRNVFYLK